MIQDFPKWQQFQSQSSTKAQTNLKQLQKIYYKNRNKKKELQQISHFNKNCVKSDNNEQNQEQPGLFDTQNLLNEQQVSFKTVQAIYTQISCISHALCIVLIIIVNRHLFIRIVSMMSQVVLIIINYFHYRYKKQGESILDNIKCLNNRSKYIILQICTIVIADVGALVIVSEPIYRYLMVFLILVDFLLIKKLKILYTTQSNMDMKPQQSQFQSFDNQFKNISN